MSLRVLHLVCCLIVLFSLNSVNAQLSTATLNGIVSAAGAPAPTQHISYSIEGEPALTATSTGIPTPSRSSGADTYPLSGNGSSLANKDQHGLSTSAVAGITVAVILAVAGIIAAVILIYRRRGQTAARAKRKSIMDMEFAIESKANLQQIETSPANNSNANTNATIGYFDIAKPLPAVVADAEPDEKRLSRSSTIIGDAAEVAQINRKASQHQRRQKAAREAVRERNHALQILITNEDNRTSVVPNSPSLSNPNTPVDASPNPQGNCTDGDGDTFAKRPSKI